MVKETSADLKVSSNVLISQAAFSSSAMNLFGANDGFEISIVSKLLSKIANKVPKKCLRHLLSALQCHCKSFIYRVLEKCLKHFSGTLS